MLPGIDFKTITFGEPRYLWLLVVPAALLVLWIWRFTLRQRDIRRFQRNRNLPSPERFGRLGDLLCWACLLMSIALTVLALSRPQAVASMVRTAGVDLVILQDGSASMYVRDGSPDRWQRSVRFLRTLAESLQWKHDRIALALFAHLAAPQVRLTSDPNTFFFFLDHMQQQSPFPLQDDTTWDTNIELGLYWGVRLIEKDEQLFGRSPNGKVFVVISDGESWTGSIDRALKLARARDIPVFVVGVGTSAGGFIPETAPEGNRPPVMSRIRSALDRESLLQIANNGGGQYFELGREPDTQIANSIIDAARRRAGQVGVQTSKQDLYWPCLVTAASFLCLGFASARDRNAYLFEIAAILMTALTAYFLVMRA